MKTYIILTTINFLIFIIMGLHLVDLQLPPQAKKKPSHDHDYPCGCRDITPDHPKDGSSYIMPQYLIVGDTISSTIWYDTHYETVNVLSDSGIGRYRLIQFDYSKKVPVYFTKESFDHATGSKIFLPRDQFYETKRKKKKIP